MEYYSAIKKNLAICDSMDKTCGHYANEISQKNKYSISLTCAI